MRGSIVWFVGLLVAVAVISVMIAFYSDRPPAEPLIGTVEARHHSPFRIQPIIHVVGKSIIQTPVPIPETWTLTVRADSGKRRTVEVSQDTYDAVKVGDRWGE